MNKKELPKLPRGMGSYDYTSTGAIRYRKSVSYNDKSMRLSVVGDTISEVNSLMKKEEAKAFKKLKLSIKDDKTKTLQEAMNDWFYMYKNGSVIDRSFDRLESTYKTHIIGSSIGTMQEQAITSDDIQEFMKNLVNHRNANKELSYSSKKKVYELLNQYFNFKYIREPYMNPMITVSKPIENNEKVGEELIIWDDEEMAIYSKEGMTPFDNGIGGYKQGALLVFVMWIFCRIGEALALQWKDIDLENETVSITKALSRVKIREGFNSGKYEYRIVKTKGKSTRSFKMCKMALDAISEYKNRVNPVSEDDYIFKTSIGTVSSISNIERLHNIICKNLVGVNQEKHITPHGLRHSGISYFIRHGVPIEVVSKLAGHKSIQITIDTYYSVIEKQKLKAINLINEESHIDILGK